MFFNQLHKIKVQESFRNHTLSFRKGSRFVHFCDILSRFLCIFLRKWTLIITKRRLHIASTAEIGFGESWFILP